MTKIGAWTFRLATGIVLAAAVLLFGQSLTHAEDAISREYSVYNDLFGAAGFTDAVSRELTVYNDMLSTVGFTDAVTREFTVYNDVLGTVGFTDAVTREFTVYNDLYSTVGMVDSISREFSTFNDLEGVDPDVDGVLTDDEDGMADPCVTGQNLLCDDNCPFDFNPDQLDSDGNGVGDVCAPPAVNEVIPPEDSLNAPEATNVSVLFS